MRKSLRAVRRKPEAFQRFKQTLFESEGQRSTDARLEETTEDSHRPEPSRLQTKPRVDPEYSSACLYQHFYGFRRPPFNNTPDPKFLFLSQKHQEALSRLLYAAQARRGFVLLTGEVGSGKTTLCRALMNRVRLTTEVALVTNSNITSKELLSSIAEELGLTAQRKSKGAILRDLHQFLIRQLSFDRNVLVILDEAQNLRGSVLEEVRMLSNLETAQEKLVQIFLVGQPELRDKINQPELRQLRQRIALRYHVLPLRAGECRDYVFHRLCVAEAERPPDFTPGALKKVYDYSEGIPRLVNTVCDNALIVGFTRETFEIDGGIMEEVISDLEGTCLPTAEEAVRLEGHSGPLREDAGRG